MGFFTSSSTSKTEYSNPTLGQYTSGYRSFSPWSFQSSDPAAFLQAYSAREGGAKDVAGIDYRGFTPEAKKQAEEEVARDEGRRKMSGDILKQLASGQIVTPEISGQVDEIFKYEEARLQEQFKLGAESLASSRGLRASDSPIARPAMQQLGMAQLGLSSARAGAKLQTGMQNREFMHGIQQFEDTMAYNKWSSRLQALYGGGMTGAANIAHTSNTKQTYTPSGFQQMAQSIGLAGSVGMMVGGGMSGNPAMMMSGQQGAVASGR